MFSFNEDDKRSLDVSAQITKCATCDICTLHNTPGKRNRIISQNTEKYENAKRFSEQTFLSENILMF
jgi:hypothetical protein